MNGFHVEYAKANEYRNAAKEALRLALGPNSEAADEIIDLIIKAAVSYADKPGRS